MSNSGTTHGNGRWNLAIVVTIPLLAVSGLAGVVAVAIFYEGMDKATLQVSIVGAVGALIGVLRSQMNAEAVEQVHQLANGRLERVAEELTVAKTEIAGLKEQLGLKRGLVPVQPAVVLDRPAQDPPRPDPPPPPVS